MLLTARPTTLRSACTLLASVLTEPLQRPFARPSAPEPRPTTPVIDRIMRLNPSATPDYLAGFSPAALDRYLSHLESMHAPRGARWERPGDSCAIVVQETEF